MAWQDLLAAGAYRAGLYGLRRGGGFTSVYQTLRGHFPEETTQSLREAAQRTVAAFQAGSALGRRGRVNPLEPNAAPWLLGQGVRPGGAPDCRWRYDVTAGFQPEGGGETQWVTVRELDADHSLSPAELREIVSATVGIWARRQDTLPGGGGAGQPTLVQMKVDFVFRC